MRKFSRRLGDPRWHIIISTLFLTTAIEAITLILRYGFHLESTKHTASTIGALTFGIRIHHSYIGFLMLALFPLMSRIPKNVRSYILIIAISLVLSDFIHHFAVLWPVEGTPQFDLVYPESN
jgi:hypothetical protein